MWNTANVTNHSVLIYKQYNDDGQELAAPQRQEPPQSAPAAIQGMQIAAGEFAMVSGQVLPEPQAKAQTRSATAVDEQAESDDDSTYHYRANLGVALMQVGRIILDLLPKIYDTPRALMALADDGSTYEVTVDQTMQQAVQVQQQADANAVQKVMLNPNVGKYEIEIDAGPSWGTRRQQAFKAMSVLLAENQGLTTIIGDLMLQASDFDLAEEAAMRLRRMVPPQALGTGPSQAEQALQQQVGKLTGLLQKSMEQVSILTIKGKAREEAREIDVFNAFTQRLKVVLDGALKAMEPPSKEQIQAVIDKAIQEALSESMEPTQEAAEEAITPLAMPPTSPLAGQPPMPGMRQGAEGGWYMRDFARSPQYRRVS
jgi:hypothetical protein